MVLIINEVKITDVIASWATNSTECVWNFCLFRNAFELQALQDAMSEVKQSLSGGNASKFEDCVEVHMQHIMSGLSRYLIETFID